MGPISWGIELAKTENKRKQHTAQLSVGFLGAALGRGVIARVMSNDLSACLRAAPDLGFTAPRISGSFLSLIDRFQISAQSPVLSPLIWSLQHRPSSSVSYAR